MELPVLSSPVAEPKVVLEAQLNYHNVISNSKNQLHASASATRTQESAPLAPTKVEYLLNMLIFRKSSYDVDLQKNRLRTADALEKVLTMNLILNMKRQRRQLMQEIILKQETS